MEIHQLRYFLAIARTGNFSRAAEACGVSQPSLSQQIAKLEAELGERLFLRLKRSSQLTPAGETMATRAARILAEIEAAREEVSAAAEQARGKVCLGILPTIAPYLLPQVLAAAGAQCPGLEIHIREATTAVLLQALADGEIDLAVASLPVEATHTTIEPLYEEELLLAVPAGHPLATKKTIGPDDLEHEAFIFLEEGHCLGEQSLRFCQRKGAQPRIVFRSAQLETIQALIAGRVGISLIPARARRTGETGQPVYRSLTSPRPTRTVAALWRRDRHFGRAAREFLEILRWTSSEAAKGRQSRTTASAQKKGRWP